MLPTRNLFLFFFLTTPPPLPSPLVLSFVCWYHINFSRWVSDSLHNIFCSLSLATSSTENEKKKCCDTCNSYFIRKKKHTPKTDEMATKSVGPHIANDGRSTMRFIWFSEFVNSVAKVWLLELTFTKREFAAERKNREQNNQQKNTRSKNMNPEPNSGKD